MTPGLALVLVILAALVLLGLLVLLQGDATGRPEAGDRRPPGAYPPHRHVRNPSWHGALYDVCRTCGLRVAWRDCCATGPDEAHEPTCPSYAPDHGLSDRFRRRR